MELEATRLAEAVAAERARCVNICKERISWHWHFYPGTEAHVEVVHVIDECVKAINAE
jgi:hypothetical protein